MPTVREIMTENPVTVRLDTPVSELQRLLDAHGFRHLPVVDRRELRGVISDRDVLRALSPFIGSLSERSQDAAALRRRAHQVMSRAAVTIGPDAELAEAAELMIETRVGCLPVVEESDGPGPGRLVGIVTWPDALAAAAGLPKPGADPIGPPAEAA